MKKVFKLFHIYCVYGFFAVLFLFNTVFGQGTFNPEITSDDPCAFGQCLNFYSCVKMFLLGNIPDFYFRNQCIDVFSMDKIMYLSYFVVFIFVVILVFGLSFIIRTIKKKIKKSIHVSGNSQL